MPAGTARADHRIFLSPSSKAAGSEGQNPCLSLQLSYPHVTLVSGLVNLRNLNNLSNSEKKQRSKPTFSLGILLILKHDSFEWKFYSSCSECTWGTKYLRRIVMKQCLVILEVGFQG